MKFTYKGGGDFTPAPEGTHMARIYSIVDIGKQPGYQGAEPVQKLVIGFELVDQPMSDGRPFVLSRFYTASLHEKASLCLMLEAIAGKRIPEEAKESFQIEKMLKAPCFITIYHKISADGKQRAEIKQVTGAPKGLEVPPLANATVFFDLDKPDWSLFDTLPDWLKAKVSRKPETAANKTTDVIDEDIPF
jgi:hypothetical protein